MLTVFIGVGSVQEIRLVAKNVEAKARGLSCIRQHPLVATHQAARYLPRITAGVAIMYHFQVDYGFLPRLKAKT